MREPLLIGSANPGKAAELAALLEGVPWDIKTLADFPEVPQPIEDGDTFEANAVKKAAYFSACFHCCCVADDSGLMVDALGGAPGTRSARYAGEHSTDVEKTARLLAALTGVPDPERTARFVCCAAFVGPGRPLQVVTGVVEGKIAMESRGRRGFGYDPVFIPNGYTQTFGEMGPEQKMVVSHRGRALRELRAYLETLR